jgi:D-beta-D-heptose 7-phosphate kinase/D-beta-D-heptose 1-phosphate adenosyltransferase
MSGRRQGGIEIGRLGRLLDRIAGLRIVVVGDVILDRYWWGASERMSPEAPVPIVRVERESAALGGAGNVARNAVALGASCVLCAVVGEDDAGRELRDLAAAEGIDARLVVDPERPTTTKARIVARGQQMLRVDREVVTPIGRTARARVLEALAGTTDVLHGAILVDYAKGGLPRAFVRRLMAHFGAADVPVAVDPKHDPAGLRGAALVKPNRAEAVRLAGLADPDRVDSTGLLARLARRLPGADLCITDGARGMTIAAAGEPALHVPTAAREIFDVQGAGDTTMAALWLARLAGGSLLEAALVANAAAGVVVGKIGTASARADEVRERLPEIVDAFRESA